MLWKDLHTHVCEEFFSAFADGRAETWEEAFGAGEDGEVFWGGSFLSVEVA